MNEAGPINNMSDAQLASQLHLLQIEQSQRQVDDSQSIIDEVIAKGVLIHRIPDAFRAEGMPTKVQELGEIAGDVGTFAVHSFRKARALVRINRIRATS